MIVRNVAIADMWSYGGPSRTVLGDLGMVNVIIGKNNAGKSNLLRALKWAGDTVELPDDKKKNYKVEPNWVHNSGAIKRGKAPHLSCSFSISIIDWPGDKLPVWMARLQTLGDEGKLNVLFTISLDGEGHPYRIIEDFKWENPAKSAELLAANSTSSTRSLKSCFHWREK